MTARINSSSYEACATAGRKPATDNVRNQRKRQRDTPCVPTHLSNNEIAHEPEQREELVEVAHAKHTTEFSFARGEIIFIPEKCTACSQIRFGAENALIRGSHLSIV